MQALNYHLIDCQVYNDHLATMGAKNIPRKKYLNMLKLALQVQPDKPFGKV
jgi:leucyl/phenylalanyl-tRNA---protein transferase